MVISDGDRRVFQALRDEQPYSFIAPTKEDCINHMKKGMVTALCSLLNKAKKGEPLGRKGGLTQDLIKKLTNYYCLATSPAMLLKCRQQ